MSDSMLLTPAEWAGIIRDPLRDRRYQQLTAIGPYIREYLEWKQLAGYAKATTDQYERDLAKQALTSPSKGLGEWKVTDIMAVIKTWPPDSRRVRRAALKNFWDWARINYPEIVRENPCERLPRFKRPAKQHLDTFSEDEVSVLCSMREIEDRTLMLILFDTGIRKGEAIRLTFGAFDLDQASMWVQGSKTGHVRVIPLTERVVQAVAELQLLEGAGDGDHLWYSVQGNQYGTERRRGNPIGNGTFVRWWARCIDDMKITYRKPHMTRHTFATSFLRSSGRIEFLSRILGHASISTTDEFYSHLVTEDLAVEMKRVLAR